jgi:hypothetical protein
MRTSSRTHRHTKGNGEFDSGADDERTLRMKRNTSDLLLKILTQMNPVSARRKQRLSSQAAYFKASRCRELGNRLNRCYDGLVESVRPPIPTPVPRLQGKAYTDPARPCDNQSSWEKRHPAVGRPSQRKSKLLAVLLVLVVGVLAAEASPLPAPFVPPPTAITYIPYTITAPRNYYLALDLTLSANGPMYPWLTAITVRSSGKVVIDMRGHKIAGDFCWRSIRTRWTRMVCIIPLPTRFLHWKYRYCPAM